MRVRYQSRGLIGAFIPLPPLFSLLITAVAVLSNGGGAIDFLHLSAADHCYYAGRDGKEAPTALNYCTTAIITVDNVDVELQ